MNEDWDFQFLHATQIAISIIWEQTNCDKWTEAVVKMTVDSCTCENTIISQGCIRIWGELFKVYVEISDIILAGEIAIEGPELTVIDFNYL